MSRKQFAEKLADGRVLLEETFDHKALGLRESVQLGRLTLMEGTAPTGTLGRVEGIAAKADIINRNKRLYSKKVYELAVGRAQSLIADNVFLGEVDHPYWGSLKEAAYRFTKLYMDGDLVRFEGVILPTPGGRLLKGLLEGGVGVQVSTRGYASATPEERELEGVPVTISVIGEDLTFEGIDFVLFASNPHGKVTQHEGAPPNSAASGGDGPSTHIEESMDIATLREKHQALVATLVSEARQGYVAQADVETQVATARTEGVEAGKQESAPRIAALEALVTAVTAALKPHVPQLQTESENVQVSEADKTIKTLEQRLVALESERNTARQEAETRAAEQAETARKTAVAEAVTTVLEGYTNADLLRDELLQCESAEKVTETFAAKKTLIESIAARLRVAEAGAQGAGTSESDPKAAHKDDTTPTNVREAINAERRAAGLEPLA